MRWRSQSVSLLVLLVGGVCLATDHVTQVSSVLQQPSSASFALSTSRSLLGVVLGSPLWSKDSTNITVSSVNGFSGNVTLSQPVTETGIIATLNTNSVLVGPSNPDTTILNVTATDSITRGSRDCIYACLYNISVTGSAGSDSQTVTISVAVTIPNFWLYGDQNLVIVEGVTEYANLTLASVFYSGNVSLTATVTPTGPRVTFNPPTVMLTYLGGGHSKAAIDTAGVLPGEYNVTVTAIAIANQTLFHKATLYVTVWQPESAPAQPSIWSLIVNYLPGIFLPVFVVAFLIITAFLDRKARKRNPSGEVSSPPVSGSDRSD
jgi:hypothetical protein